MKRSAVVAVGAAAFLAMPLPANAVKPARGCPPDFQLMNEEQIFEIVRVQFPNVTEEQFHAFFLGLDKNADGLACLQNKKEGQNPNGIDNTSN